MYSFVVLLSQFGTILLFHAHSIASWRVYRFLRGHITWSGIPISFRIFHSLLWSTQSKSFDIVNKTEVGVFMKFSCFFYDPLNFGNLLSGFSTFFPKSSSNIWKFMVHVFIAKAWLGEFWALRCQHVRWVWFCSNLNTFWHCLSLGLEQKLTFSSSVATAEFSTFVVTLSAALSEYHVLGFEIAHLEFHHLH